MRVSEIRVNQIRVNQGLGVYNILNVNIIKLSPKLVIQFLVESNGQPPNDNF